MSAEVERLEAVARTWRWAPVAFNRRHNGPQLLFRFANGYGASVVGEIDFDAMVARGYSPSTLMEPMPILAGEVEIAVIRWHGDVDRTTGDWATAEGLAGVDRFEVATDIDSLYLDGYDGIFRHVSLAHVERIFESIEALTVPGTEVEA